MIKFVPGKIKARQVKKDNNFSEDGNASRTKMYVSHSEGSDSCLFPWKIHQIQRTQ